MVGDENERPDGGEDLSADPPVPLRVKSQTIKQTNTNKH